MGRRNKHSSDRRLPVPAAGPTRPVPSERPAPKANLPRPNKLFLAIAALLLLLWIGFLGIMALLVRA